MRKKFPRRDVITLGLDELLQADLVEMNSGQLNGISKINNGYAYILSVIDVFSKYAWAVPVKSKSGLNVSAAMNNTGWFFYRSPKIPAASPGQSRAHSPGKPLTQLPCYTRPTAAPLNVLAERGVLRLECILGTSETHSDLPFEVSLEKLLRCSLQ